MNGSVNKGNNTECWTALLDSLSEKLQLNLLDKLRKVTSYHFEDGKLFIIPSSFAEYEYFLKDHVAKQLNLLAQDACKVKKVEILKPD